MELHMFNDGPVKILLEDLPALHKYPPNILLKNIRLLRIHPPFLLTELVYFRSENEDFGKSKTFLTSFYSH